MSSNTGMNWGRIVALALASMVIGWLFPWEALLIMTLLSIIGGLYYAINYTGDESFKEHMKFIFWIIIFGLAWVAEGAQFLLS